MKRQQAEEKGNEQVPRHRSRTELELLEGFSGSQWLWKGESRKVHGSQGTRKVIMCRSPHIKVRI